MFNSEQPYAVALERATEVRKVTSKTLWLWAFRKKITLTDAVEVAIPPIFKRVSETFALHFVDKMVV